MTDKTEEYRLIRQCYRSGQMSESQLTEHLNDAEFAAWWGAQDTPASVPTEGATMELDGVAEEIAEGDGFWRSCSGCHETSEGVPLGPYSSIMQCHLGMGCRECGGIGAIWDATDYKAMGDFIASEGATAPEAVKDDREAEVARLRRVLKSARTAMEIANKHGYSDWSDFIADIDAALNAEGK